MKSGKILLTVAIATMVAGSNIQDAHAIKMPAFLKKFQKQEEQRQVDILPADQQLDLQKPVIQKPKVIKEDFNSLVYNKSNVIGLTYNENSLVEISNMISGNKLYQAQVKLDSMVDWLERSTEYHAELFKVLKKIDNAKYQAELEKKLALKTAVLRDKAIYQRGLLYVKQHKKKDAVNCFIHVVKSQPRTTIGHDAYKKLQEIGFTYRVQLEDVPQTIEAL